MSQGEANIFDMAQFKKDGMALYRYDGNSFTKIIGKYSSGDNQIFGATEDKNGNIWFGTMNGVYSYDGKSLTNFTENVPPNP